jgi:hypothetical protein
MNFVPHPSYFSLFHLLKIKLNNCKYEMIEVMEAESQAVLNALTEHDSQNAF